MYFVWGLLSVVGGAMLCEGQKDSLNIDIEARYYAWQQYNSERLNKSSAIIVMTGASRVCAHGWLENSSSSSSSESF